MMGVVKAAAWIVAVGGIVYLSLVDSMSKSEAHIAYVKSALEKLHAEHHVVDVTPVDTSLLSELQAQHEMWRREWHEITQLDAMDRDDAMAQWTNTKKKILDDVASRTAEVDQVRAIERRAMHILREWKVTRESIAHTTAQIAVLQRTIERQEIDNAATKRQAQAHADAIEHLRWAQQARERLLENEKLAAEESIVRRKFWSRSLLLVMGLVLFGVIMMALDKDRKKGTNLRLYDYSHGKAD
ncbi:hypothetical protein ACHHYP_12344 [Achlya hypogyna]|uniref:Uncharacterized protein n=1 Tax=Achlya hypogyna TaxID=1202772 RepID=A0A1V9ZGW9_ACHHY|nr:hypothetical protein ACHHYP_12344 [Achlya hypogyna]